VQLAKGDKTAAATAGGITMLTIKGRNLYAVWIAAALALMGGLLVAVIIIRKRAAAEETVRARDVFRMPQEMDPFILVKLLRNISVSSLVNMKDDVRDQLAAEIAEIEKKAFDPANAEIGEEELRATARKWLKRL
jgi:hypothetical protein